ncbi:MAG: FHA domain-containing protein [Ignavibacteria bacterium]|nr:FHA domain-containing protein [Ignavibacteria bacterium]
MGISLATGGPSMKKRMTVTPLLETQQPNVYLIGDILSQAYLETADFTADPSAFREIKHRGNIKAALVDGVYVADVIKQKLEGRTDIRVEIQLSDEAPAASAKGTDIAAPLAPRVVESAGPPPESIAPAREVRERGAYLVRLLPGNVEEDEYPLRAGGMTTLGKNESDISFSNDQFLSERHASITQGPDGYTLRDEGSENGVLYRAPEGVALEVVPGQLVKLGRQFLRFQGSGGVSGFVHYNGAGAEIRRVELREGTIVAGRDAPDITLDADDGTMSRRHLSIAMKGGRVFIKDLKSTNGTWLRLLAPVPLKNDDQFRIGQQLLRFVMKEEISSDRLHSGFHPAYVPEPQPEAAEAPAAQAPQIRDASPASMAADGAGAVVSATEVTFQNIGRSVPLEKGRTICEIAEKNGITIVAECHAGICGSDPIRIIAGGESLAPPGDDETGTLEDICGLKAGECRLACMVRPGSGLVVDILKNE